MHRLFSLRRGAIALVATLAVAVVGGGVTYSAASGGSGRAQAATGRMYACVTARFRTLNLTTGGAVSRTDNSRSPGTRPGCPDGGGLAAKAG